MYRLKEADGDFIQGTFYEQELQKVIETPDHLFRQVSRERCRQRSTGTLERLPSKYAALQATGGIVIGMIQDNDFYITLPSNASSNLFLTNSKSSYRVALSREIYFEKWRESGSGTALYCISVIMVGHSSHVLLQSSCDFNLFTLP